MKSILTLGLLIVFSSFGIAQERAISHLFGVAMPLPVN